MGAEKRNKDGLDKAGIKLIGEGSVADDEILNDMGDPALGLVTSHPYSVAPKATQGSGGGEALVKAMKGQIFESPRGPIYIDAQTRDIVQNVYIRRVERIDGQLVEVDVMKDVKDPARDGK